MKKYFILLIIALSLVPCVVFPQKKTVSDSTEKLNLMGRHSVGLNLGIINQTSEVAVDVTNTSTNMNFQASVSYNYWLTEEIAFDASVGYLSSSVNSNVSVYGVEQKTATVTPVFLGAKYYPSVISFSGGIKPYLKLLVGVVFGSITEENVNYTYVSTNTSTQSVISVRSGIGADAFASSHFRIGLDLDYLYMPDFTKPVGTRKNYSGVNLSFSFGIII